MTGGVSSAGPRPGDSDAAVRLPEQFCEVLQARGIGRRRFLQYCAGLAGVLALPSRMTGRIARGLADAAASSGPPRVIWLAFQDCAGCTEAFLRSQDPDVASLVFGMIALDYQETLMAAAGAQAEAARQAAMATPGYLLIVEGSIPQGMAGAMTVGGKAASDLLTSAAGNAAAIVAVGTCASFGGIPNAHPNPTGAVSAGTVVSDARVLNLSGCPPNADNIGATLAYWLTFKDIPETDQLGRPLFAYGDRIHDHCERRAYFDAGQFALDFGDQGHADGWCLYKLGCKGPDTFNNCAILRFNDNTSWPVEAGHGCAGCAEPHFWDTMTPFYSQLPGVAGFGAEATAEDIGVGVVAATAAVFTAHGIGKAIQHRVARRHAEREPKPEEGGADGRTAHRS